MSDVEIRFEREGIDGLVGVGSNVADTVKRFGIRFENDCQPTKDIHFCALVVSKGGGLLSPPSETETEHFAANGRRSNERLACEARIIKSGEIVIMTDQKKEETKKTGAPKDRFQAEFEALPLDRKFASLMKMELATLNEAFTYAVNSPMKVVEKFGDVITEFGTKIENEVKKAAQANREHKAPRAAKKPAAKTKARPARKSTPPGTAKG